MEEVSILRFVLAFAFVLGLIGLFAVGLKRFSGRLPGMKLGGAGRLKVVEMAYVSPRHRLVLISRDGVEHLLLIGPDSQTVVETGIKNDKS